MESPFISYRDWCQLPDKQLGKLNISECSTSWLMQCLRKRNDSWTELIQWECFGFCSGTAGMSTIPDLQGKKPDTWQAHGLSGTHQSAEVTGQPTGLNLRRDAHLQGEVRCVPWILVHLLTESDNWHKTFSEAQCKRKTRSWKWRWWWGDNAL